MPNLRIDLRSDPAATHGGWSGLGGDGHGRPRQRQIQVRATRPGPPQRGGLLIARAVSDLRLAGNRCPSDDDIVPPPHTDASGRQWCWFTIAVLAARGESLRRYHSEVQARAL
jgi:hypothetical protein